MSEQKKTNKKRKFNNEADDITQVQHLEIQTKVSGQRVTKQWKPAKTQPAPPKNEDTQMGMSTRQRFDPTPVSTPLMPEGQLEPETAAQPTKKFSQGYYLRRWKYERCQRHLQRLLEMEHRSTEQCSQPKCLNPGLIRCNDCFAAPVLCTNCCLTSHKLLPFHRIKRWNGLFFEPSWLIDIGLIVHLGHQGLPCPPSVIYAVNSAPDVVGTPDHDNPVRTTDRSEAIMTIVDVSAVHQVRVRWCKCAGSESKDMQLFSLRLFPSSFDEPQSAITFQALEDARLTNLECNTAISRWYSKLCRLTNPAFPSMVKDRYREVARTGRAWRYLNQLAENGFGHTLSEPKEGELATFCPACPQPGINLPPGWENDPEKWKYCRNIVVDGNFSADHVRMSNVDDVTLTDGTGYMATSAAFQEHLRTAQTRNQKPTCNEHKAASRISSSKQNLDITGICGAACSRHGCWIPGSVTDFTKGEAQPPVDYSVDRGLKYNSDGLKQFMLLYDINCQYSIHMGWRFENSPCISLPSAMVQLTHGIGLFHVHGHKDECEFRYSPTYIPGAAKISGEIIEPLWEPLNPIAPSTRVSSHPLRREMIDDHMADSNRKKEYRIIDATMAKYRKAEKDVEESTAAFEDLSANLTQDQLNAYKKAEQQAQADRFEKVSAMDIYGVQMEKAPSVSSILAQLTTQTPATSSVPGNLVQWIAMGLNLEGEILALKAKVLRMSHDLTEKQSIDLARQRQRIQTQIDSFHTDSTQYMVELQNTANSEITTNLEDEGIFVREEQDFQDQTITGDDDNDELTADFHSIESSVLHPEDTTLLLPSNVDSSTSARGFSEDVKAVELELRKGLLNDSIHHMRLLIADKSVLFRTEVRSAKSQSKKTRAWAHIRQVQAGLDRHRRMYNRSRRAIMALGAKPDLLKLYQELKPTHLKASTAVIQPNACGQRNVGLSWIWSFSTGRSSTDSSWMKEYYRVSWLKAKARKDRAEEELALLQHEMNWIINSFQFKQDRWTGFANESDDHGKPGHASFARRQAALWKAFRDRAVEMFGDHRVI